MIARLKAWALWILNGFADALVWVLTAEAREIDRLRMIPGFERDTEEAFRLDNIQGGRRNMHRVLDKYGVPDARWFK